MALLMCIILYSSFNYNAMHKLCVLHSCQGKTESIKLIAWFYLAVHIACYFVFRAKQSTVSQLKVRFSVFTHVTMFEEDVKKVKLNETGRQNYCSYAKDVKL